MLIRYAVVKNVADLSLFGKSLAEYSILQLHTFLDGEEITAYTFLNLRDVETFIYYGIHKNNLYLFPSLKEAKDFATRLINLNVMK